MKDKNGTVVLVALIVLTSVAIYMIRKDLKDDSSKTQATL
jgi:hypothetical protein